MLNVFLKGGRDYVFMLKITIMIRKQMLSRATIGYKKCKCSKILVILLAIKYAIDEINMHARFARCRVYGHFAPQGPLASNIVTNVA